MGTEGPGFLCCGKRSPFSLLGRSDAGLCQGEQAARQSSGVVPWECAAPPLPTALALVPLARAGRAGQGGCHACCPLPGLPAGHPEPPEALPECPLHPERHRPGPHGTPQPLPSPRGSPGPGRGLSPGPREMGWGGPCLLWRADTQTLREVGSPSLSSWCSCWWLRRPVSSRGAPCCSAPSSGLPSAPAAAWTAKANTRWPLERMAASPRSLASSDTPRTDPPLEPRVEQMLLVTQRPSAAPGQRTRRFGPCPAAACPRPAAIRRGGPRLSPDITVGWGAQPEGQPEGTRGRAGRE
ncbi:tetraspanin-32 isoform X2 [Eulemur rufifrons]|uniref:tetraspanin-32 isoform X2 n=1 Tax=Eulemur rufifrons TaxID=859984 RepID=UPI003743CF1E